MSIKGSCLCGAIAYEITGKLEFVGNCQRIADSNPVFVPTTDKALSVNFASEPPEWILSR